MNTLFSKRLFSLTSVLAVALLAITCLVATKSHAQTVSRETMVEKSRTALKALYETTPRAKELASRAKAILVFPDIMKGGLIIGGSGGSGVLFSPEGEVQGYYNASSVSIGLQAGAESYSEVLFLMTPEAIKHLSTADGWSIGTGPTIVVIDQGASADFSTTTGRSDVYAFIYGQKGLMGGIGLQGQKITKLKP